MSKICIHFHFNLWYIFTWDWILCRSKNRETSFENASCKVVVICTVGSKYVFGIIISCFNPIIVVDYGNSYVGSLEVTFI